MDDKAPKRLRKSKDKVIAGVCGGIADWLDWDPTVVRVGYVTVTIVSAAFPGIRPCAADALQ